MKKKFTLFIFLLCLHLLNVNAFAFDFMAIPAMLQKPREYLLAHPEALKEQLETMIDGRCKRYIQNSREECELSSKEFIQILNLSTVNIDNTNYVVSLTQDLDQVMKDKRLEAYLRELNSELDETAQSLNVFKFVAPQMVKKFDLGFITLKHFKNQKIAIKVMATLFQDIFPNGIPAHLSYLHDKFGDSENLNNLLAINNKIGNLTQKNGILALTIFNNQMTNQKIYHYLVPAYLAVKMRYLNKRSDISFFHPFIFNYLYEISENKNALRAFFLDPKSITDTSTKDDIMMGEAGAALGIGKNGPLLPESQSRALLQSTPIEYIKALVEAASDPT